jgi:3-methyl-2-oxobutanoate hydroxymethyltransferase
MKTVLDFAKKKQLDSKFSMVTCYDFWSAQILAASDIDCILVGDSAAMVMHGHDSTVPMDIKTMAAHVSAVKKGAPEKFIIADMPFLSHRKGTKYTMDCVEQLMRAGANSVKIEAQPGHEKIIRHVVDSGVPVMGHIGLTPQFVHQLGGYKVQGRDTSSALRLMALAKILEEAGCFSLVLECIPELLAKKITAQLQIPTIGIGSGNNTDGQVLVLQDLLGCQKSFQPKFVRHYTNLYEIILGAVNSYHKSVAQNDFPSEKEVYQ